MSTTILERDPHHHAVPETTSPDADGPNEPVADETCEHCHGTEPFGDSEWCPQCGFHPRWKRVFDVDSGSWDDQPADWRELVPPWAQVTALGVVGIVALGLVVRFQYTAPQRAMCTLTELLVGLLAFGAGHMAAYTYATMETDKFGPFDMFMNPFGIWRATFRDLPAHAWRVWTAAWGATAVCVALFVVGGINWMGIFEEDWGIKKSAQPNLVNEVVDKARKEQGGEEESLEDAVNGVAGKEQEEEKPKPLQRADCVLIGFTQDSKGTLQELVLASMYRKELRYVGTLLCVDLPPQVREELQRVLPKLVRDSPFVDCKVSGASWLHPMKAMRVRYEGWSSRGRLKAARFEEMLGDLR